MQLALAIENALTRPINAIDVQAKMFLPTLPSRSLHNNFVNFLFFSLAFFLVCVCRWCCWMLANACMAMAKRKVLH